MANSAVSKNKISIPVLMVSFALLLIPHGILNETYQLYKILSAKEKGFSQALNDLNIPPDLYITPDQLIAESGKNIIVISIESLEQGFLVETSIV